MTMRNTIEPMFQAGVSAENARHGRKDGSDEAISLELMLVRFEAGIRRGER